MALSVVESTAVSDVVTIRQLSNVVVSDSTAVSDPLNAGWTLIAHTGLGSPSSGVTTSPINTIGANLLILSLASGDSLGNLTDSQNNTWIKLTTYRNSNGAGRDVTIYYVVNPSVSASHTFSVDTNANFPAIYIQAWSGGGGQANFDVQNGNATVGSQSGPLQPGNLTPNLSGELIVASFVQGDVTVASFAINSGFTITDQTPRSGSAEGGALAYLVQPSAATVNPSWSWGGTALGAACGIACFRLQPQAGLSIALQPSASDSTVVSDAAHLTIIAAQPHVSDSTAVSDAVNLTLTTNLLTTDFTVVSDVPTIRVSNPQIVVFDATAVTSEIHFPIISNLFAADSTAVSDSFFKDRPNDRCTGPDFFAYAQAPGLFEYGGVLYQMTNSLIGFDSNLNPLETLIIKTSPDRGQTWVTAASLGSTSGTYFGSTLGFDLFGTKLYFVYDPFLSLVFGYFDFTTLTFNVLAVSGSPVIFYNTMFLEVADDNHMFLVGGFGEVTVSAITSGAYTTLGSVSLAGMGYSLIGPEAVIYGSSGILHVFLTASFFEGPADLWYFNVIAGVLSTPVRVRSGYSEGVPSEGFPTTSAGPALQVGSTILFSFYNPLNQAVEILYFTDSASPVFGLRVVDSSWPLVLGAFNGAGSGISTLAYYAGVLYCFYSNYNNGSNGDGIAYYRTSTNLGITWSALYQIGQHIDPSTLAPGPIYQPNTIQVVGGGNPVNSPLLTTWEQA